MVITLYTEEILNRIKLISHREVSEIADVEARYRAEAGTEKTADIQRCISDAHSRLVSACRRFLNRQMILRATNETVVPDCYEYQFNLSERRAANNTEPLTEAMNNFIIEYALSKFYSMVSQGDLSNKHSLLALDANKRIDTILYTKLPPRV